MGIAPRKSFHGKCKRAVGALSGQVDRDHHGDSQSHTQDRQDQLNRMTDKMTPIRPREQAHETVSGANIPPTRRTTRSALRATSAL